MLRQQIKERRIHVNPQNFSDLEVLPLLFVQTHREMDFVKEKAFSEPGAVPVVGFQQHQRCWRIDVRYFSHAVCFLCWFPTE